MCGCHVLHEKQSLLHKLCTLCRYSPVRGQSAFTAMPSALSSSAMPSTHIDMPYLAMVYAVMRRREKGGREEEEREDKGGGIPEINPC